MVIDEMRCEASGSFEEKSDRKSMPPAYTRLGTEEMDGAASGVSMEA